LIRVLDNKPMLKAAGSSKTPGSGWVRTFILIVLVGTFITGPSSLFGVDGDGDSPPVRISSRTAVLEIDNVDFVYKADAQGAPRLSIPVRISGNQLANYVQLSIDYDRETLVFLELKIEHSDWVLWPGAPVTHDPDGRVLATLLDTGNGSRPSHQESGLHFVSLNFHLIPGNLPVDNYHHQAPLSFTPYDPGSLTQDPREDTLAGTLDLSNDDDVLDLLNVHLENGGAHVFYADGIEVGGGGLTRREQKFILPLFITDLGGIDTINVGVDYDELILDLLQVRPTIPVEIGGGPGRELVDIAYRTAPSGADFSLDLTRHQSPGSGAILRQHVADLEFHYAGELLPGDGRGQGGLANFIGGRLVVQPSSSDRTAEGRGAGEGGRDLRLIPGYLRVLRPYFVRGNVDSSILDYRAPEDGALMARDEFRASPDLGDPVAILHWLFSPAGARQIIPCMEAADTDDDGTIQIDDAVLLLTTLFIGGDSPAAPFPFPGPDRRDSPMDLGCDVPLPVFAGD
jgi:hypothetical protein